MINFKIYNANTLDFLAMTLTREDAITVANCDENINKRIMIVKHDTEKSDEIVNRTTGKSYVEMSCVELKNEITKNVKVKGLKK